MNLQTLCFSSLAALLLATWAAAQDLGLGSKAPALSVEEWIQGEAVTAFQPGRVYVVEFWATWCPPCRTSIPHINGLAREHKDKVTVLGIAGFERYKQLDAGRTVLANFVKSQGEKMTYPVGFDTDQSMAKSWMEPARQLGIPTAFIVDGSGTIAWIGNPTNMERPLAAIVKGEWDAKAEAEKARQRQLLEQKAGAVFGSVAAAYESKDYAAVMKAYDEAIAKEPRLEELLGSLRFEILLRTKDYAAASAYGAKLLAGALKDDAQRLIFIAWLVVNPEDETVEQRDFAFAIAAAKRACELESKDATFLDTLGTAYFGSGEIAKAIEVQTRAVELAKGTNLEAELAGRLARFKEAAKGKE